MRQGTRPLPLLLLVGIALGAAATAQADWNAELAAIDAEIRAVAGATHPEGNTVNVLAGVSPANLEQKRLILAAAGLNWFAPPNASGSYNYGNFYSFTGTAGQTDTQLRLVETTGATLLYRRGFPNEPAQRLGAWWGSSYLSPEATRDELAVLDAWGNPLSGIYVLSVPAGTRMIAGLAAPMQAGDEFRPGGATQYWLNSRDNTWLVHALHAPDYLGSYVLALAGAQKMDRETLEGVTAQLRDLAPDGERGTDSSNRGFDSWFRFTSGDTDYRPLPGNAIAARGESFLWGSGATLIGSSRTARLHAGVMVGRATLRQTDTLGGLANRIAGDFGGLYGVYRQPSATRLPWYVSGTLRAGRLRFDNTVPGYLGRGLTQRYRGRLLSGSLEAGLPLALGRGWTVASHAQLAASRVAHDDFRDALGAVVAIDRSHTIRARLGAQLEKTLLQRQGRELSLRMGAAAIREVSGRNKIAVAGETATGRRAEAVYQLEAGLRFRWTDRYALQGGISRVDGDEEGFRGSASVAIAW